MNWESRIRDALYTSASGLKTVFAYENVGYQLDKKTTAFNFPDANGTYIQDLGNTGRRYKLRTIFYGNNYDQAAEFFIALLEEKGTGILEHPVYGKLNVVPYGTISRRDDLKTAANQAIIEVEFWETIGLIYPTGQIDQSSATLQAIDDFNTAITGEFKDSTNTESTTDKVDAKNKYKQLLDNAKAGLQSIADKQKAVEDQFNSVYSSINNGIDTFIQDPLTLAYQTTILLQAPARALGSITHRLNAYRNLAESILSGDGGVSSPSSDSSSNNEYHINDLYVSSYVTGQILSAVNNEFETKSEAIETAEEILDLFDEVVEWRDANIQSLSEIDTGASYQKLQDAVAIATAYLVEISFTLKQERSITLDRARTIIDVTAELYDSVDDKLDFLINSNNLTGSEILELPKGKTILYYV